MRRKFNSIQLKITQRSDKTKQNKMMNKKKKLNKKHSLLS